MSVHTTLMHVTILTVSEYIYCKGLRFSHIQIKSKKDIAKSNDENRQERGQTGRPTDPWPTADRQTDIYL